MRADSSEPTAEAPSVPSFTLEEIGDRLDSRLGRGTTSVAYSLRGYQNLAVKEIQLSGLDKSSVNAIRLELATVPGLAHPGIVKYHQVIWGRDLVYIVMDRHDKTIGRLITEHKRKKIPVPIELVISVMRQVAAAFAYLHSVSGVDASGTPFQGLVHRDLKPANVLISEDGEHFVIADFGLCKDALRSGRTLAGTKPYMAPETLVHNKTSPASDMWSLGAVVYELVTTRRLDFLEDREPKDVLITGWKPDLSGVADGFIRYILERIFVLEPEKRLTARELCETLTTFDIPVSELGSQCVMLRYKCGSLEAALDGANARIVLLEGRLRVELDRIALLKGRLRAKSNRIADLEAALKNRSSGTKSLGKKSRIKVTGIDVFEGQSPSLKLICAARTNDVEIVRMLLEEGVRTGRRDKQGMTALMHAAQQGHTGLVELLVEKEKGIKDKNGWTALMYTAYSNHSEVIKIIAPHEHGKRDKNNRTALMIAAEEGSFEAVRVLVEHEKGLKDDNGCTALVHAARAGHCDVAKLLIDHEKNVISWTMLMLAAALGDTDLASRHLGEKGQKDKQGQTALIIAAQSGKDEAVKLLMRHERGVSGWTDLIYSAYLGDIDAIKENLHEKGRQDDAGITALMWAAHQGHKGAVEILLEHEKGLKDNNGHTAFMHALETKHADIAALLREHEDPSWTPLMRAAAAGDIEAVKMHLSDKDKKNSDGETALIIAARAGHKDIVELLDPTDRSGFTALMRAADSNDLATARALLPLQGGMKMTGEVEIAGWYINKGTALMIAARYGHTEVVRLLVEKEGGMCSSDGWTALMWAARRGHQECVKLLVDHKGERDASGWTDLMYAACLGDVDAVRNNLQQAGRKGSRRLTALMVAADNGHTGVARLLVEKEGGMSDSDGWTALMKAAYNGHAKCVELLLEKEGGMQESDGWTALMGAAARGHTDCARLLLEKEGGMSNSSGRTALMWAAYNGHTGVARLLVEKEGGMSDSDGWTALMKAAYNGHAKCVELLLEKEGGMQESDGRTALMYAAANGHTEVARLLVEKEGGMSDSDGWTALMVAAQEGHTGVARLLVEKEGGMSNSSGRTALMVAADNGHTGVARLLVEKEGGMGDSKEWTALMKAAYNGHAKCVELLLEKEGGVKDNNGKTALMWAAANGHAECARLLLEKEKDMRSDSGDTALDIAKRHNHPSVVSLLSE